MNIQSLFLSVGEFFEEQRNYIVLVWFDIYIDDIILLWIKILDNEWCWKSVVEVFWSVTIGFVWWLSKVLYQLSFSFISTRLALSD